VKKLIAFLLIAGSIGVFGVKVIKKVQWTQQVTGYLKHAADANTIPLALQELTKVINYLEAKDLTEGYTSIFYKTPGDDIGFWYQNLKASQAELQNLKSTSALERTNVLMKLRETLTDSGKKSRVTYPRGIDTFPNNKLWAVLLMSATVALFAGCTLLIPTETKDGKTQFPIREN
jgi:hypothetical protein